MISGSVLPSFSGLPLRLRSQITVGGRSFLARASIVHGEVPLLLSRSVLSGFGMVYNVEVNVARFQAPEHPEPQALQALHLDIQLSL